MSLIKQLKDNSFKIEATSCNATTLVDAVPIFTVERIISDAVKEFPSSQGVDSVDFAIQVHEWQEKWLGIIKEDVSK
jgi:hypothetical protein